MLSLPISFKGQPGGDGGYSEAVQVPRTLFIENDHPSCHRGHGHRKSLRGKFYLQTNLKFSKDIYYEN